MALATPRSEFRSGPEPAVTVLKLTANHDLSNQSLESIVKFSEALVEAAGDEPEFNITLDTAGESW
jgi:hypothetical protein